MALGLYLLIYPDYGLLAVVPTEVVLLTVWYLFFKNTTCDFEGRRGPCYNPAYGKLRGCKPFPSHSRGKRSAILASLNLSNPENVFRPTWQDSRPSQPRPVTIPSVAAGQAADWTRLANRAQARFNLVSLAVAVVGSAAGVLALFIDPGA